MSDDGFGDGNEGVFDFEYSDLQIQEFEAIDRALNKMGAGISVDIAKNLGSQLTENIKGVELKEGNLSEVVSTLVPQRV